MRKRLHLIITALSFLLYILGAAGLDSENMAPAIVMALIGAAGMFEEGFYWRRLYEH